MEDLEKALRNIDVFCRILVKKIVEGEDCPQKTSLEPIENLLRRKHAIDRHVDSSPLAKHLIPLPDAEKPLIDVFEDDTYVKILMKCHCKNPKVTVHTEAGNLKISTGQCGKLDLPVQNLQIENMTVRCNNEVLQISIPKMETTISCGN